MTKLTGSLGVRNEINVDIIGTGARGKEGKSVYEIWLDLGNEGTEQEYLASLKGQDGYTPIKGIDYFDGEQGPKGDKGGTGEVDYTTLDLKADKTYVDSKVQTDVPSGAKFTDTITTINGKTGAISKADIVALGIPEQDTIYTHPTSHPASMITGLPTSLPANGGDATTSKHLVGDDTRMENSNPPVYMNGGSRYVGRIGWQTEFKYVSIIGLTGLLNGTYCYLQTHTPWSDPSGGYPIQVAYGDGAPCWRVGVSTSAWGAWQKVSDGGNANTVNGFSVGVNVPSNAKFTDTNTITTINGKTGAITKADITALGIPAQDTVVDISGKADKTYVDSQDLKQMPISGGALENYREKLVTLSGTSTAINLSLGNVFAHTLSGNTTYSISNAVNGQAHSFTLIITQTGTVRTLNFPCKCKVARWRNTRHDYRK